MELLENSVVKLIKELIARVNSSNPNIVLAEGSPVYELLIKKYADFISEERNLVNVLTNIARVAPMFDEYGKLLPEYKDMEEALLERFFVALPETNEIITTVYLGFSQKDNIFIKKSPIYYNSTVLYLKACRININSPLWYLKNGVYYHPIPMTTLAEEEIFIPATNSWIIGDVEYNSGNLQTVPLSAESKQIINTNTSRELTLDYLQDSISLRSYSNARSLRYNLKTNSVFRYDKLLRNNILTAHNAEYIERRKIIYEDSTEFIEAVVGGDCKLMLDYGVELEIEEVELEYLPADHPLYQDLTEFNIIENPYNILSCVYLTSLTDLNIDKIRGAFYLKPCRVARTTDLNYDFYIELYAEIDSLIPLYTSSSIVIEDNCLPNITLTFYKPEDFTPHGFCVCSYSNDYFNHYSNKRLLINYAKNSLYRVNTSSLGLFCPLALGSLAEATAIKNKLVSTLTEDIIKKDTKATALYPEGNFLASGTHAEVIQSITIKDNNLGLLFGSSSYRTYWAITSLSTGGLKLSLSTDPTFTNSENILAVVPIPENYVAGQIIISPLVNREGSVSVTFSRNFEEIPQCSSSYDNFIFMPGQFLKIANDYLVYSMNSLQGATNAGDREKKHLLYLRTPLTYLNASQQMLLSKQALELGSRIRVAPFRPIIFTVYYSTEYFSPFIIDKEYTDPALSEKLAAIKHKYVDMLVYLSNYFSNYKASILDLDFSQLSADVYNTTGLFLKKLDYVLCTQRGNLLRGQVDINMETSSYLNWEEIEARILTEVDIYCTPERNKFFIDSELESCITVSELYRPVFSKLSL